MADYRHSYKKVCHFGQFLLNIRKVRGFGLVEEQCFSLIFVQLKLVMDVPLLYNTNTVLHVAEKIISGGVRS